MKENDLHKFLQYTLTTDIYKADLKQHLPKNLLPEIDATYVKVVQQDKRVIVKLLNLINKYPEHPQFKNFLTTSMVYSTGLIFTLPGMKRKKYPVF